MPRLRWIGLVPKLLAMAGSAVVITVPSRFSMNRAQATIRGTIIERVVVDAVGMHKGGDSEEESGAGDRRYLPCHLSPIGGRPNYCMAGPRVETGRERLPGP